VCPPAPEPSPPFPKTAPSPCPRCVRSLTPSYFRKANFRRCPVSSTPFYTPPANREEERFTPQFSPPLSPPPPTFGLFLKIPSSPPAPPVHFDTPLFAPIADASLWFNTPKTVQLPPLSPNPGHHSCFYLRRPPSFPHAILLELWLSKPQA